jgi:low density lipoprotein receptor-related protein 5/6
MRPSRWSGPFSRFPLRVAAVLLLVLPAVCEVALATDWMYWTETNPPIIRRAHLDGTSIQDVVTTGLVTPLVVKVAGGRIYWTDFGNGTIQSAELDGSSPQPLVTGQASVSGLAVDLVNGRLYWSVSDRIWRAGLDGTQPAVIYSSSGSLIPDLAVDGASGSLYWSDHTYWYIQRSDLDGAGVQLLFRYFPCRYPIGLALNLGGGTVYWANHNPSGLVRGGLNGTGAQVLVTPLDPQRVAVDATAGKVYWTDQGTGKIQRANLNGTGVEDVLGSLPALSGIDLAQTAAGAVPDGSIPGDPLMLATGDDGSTVLSWGVSCAGDPDYAVYRGDLGSASTLAPLACTTGGARTFSEPPDSLPTVDGGYYYLVVPHSVVNEGSYGTDSQGLEHPASAQACFPQEIDTCLVP